jgi:hypothetical protein
MVVTEVTTIPTWRAQKQVRSFFLMFSVQTYVHEKLLSCPLDKHVYNPSSDNWGKRSHSRSETYNFKYSSFIEDNFTFILHQQLSRGCRTIEINISMPIYIYDTSSFIEDNFTFSIIRWQLRSSFGFTQELRPSLK